eukprot:2332741-Pyramimonas_sp.AAC.2
MPMLGAGTLPGNPGTDGAPWVSLYHDTLGSMKLRIDEHALPDPPMPEPDEFSMKVFKSLQVCAHDGPIVRRKRGYILMMDQS